MNFNNAKIGDASKAPELPAKKELGPRLQNISTPTVS